MDISSDKNDQITLTLPDSKVLDCYICFQPLSAPISQCENGHSVCYICRTKIGESCPSCAQPMSSIRNRALETVLDTLKVKCQNQEYGCKSMLTYGMKTSHEKICSFSPCSCPVRSCDFKGLSFEFSTHICPRVSENNHFAYGQTIRLGLKRHNHYFVLQESTDHGMFIVENFKEAFGQGITVSRFACPASESERFIFYYDLTLANNQRSIKYESAMKNVQKKVGKLYALEDHLLIPSSSFSSSDGLVKAKLRICRCPILAEQHKKAKISTTE